MLSPQDKFSVVLTIVKGGRLSISVCCTEHSRRLYRELQELITDWNSALQKPNDTEKPSSPYIPPLNLGIERVRVGSEAKGCRSPHWAVSATYPTPDFPNVKTLGHTSELLFEKE